MFLLQQMTSHANGKSISASRKRDPEITELLKNIAMTKLELELANQNFSYAVDPLLVDMYSYQIKAAQAKYRYLLKKARSMQIRQHEYLSEVLQEDIGEL